MEKFARIEALLGQEAVKKIAATHVAVIGLGGVGSYAAEALARSGVGQLTLVDHDTIEASNINRQLIALESSLGKLKTEVMAQRLHDINPELIITTHSQRIREDNQGQILTPEPDFVIDAIDDVEAKVALIWYCQHQGLEIISAMGTANRLNPGALKVANMKTTHTCPLAKKLRKLLKLKSASLDFPVVFSEEVIENKPAADGGIKLGTMAFVPGTAGLHLAAAVIRKIIHDKYTY